MNGFISLKGQASAIARWRRWSGLSSISMTKTYPDLDAWSKIYPWCSPTFDWGLYIINPYNIWSLLHVCKYAGVAFPFPHIHSCVFLSFCPWSLAIDPYPSCCHCAARWKYHSYYARHLGDMQRDEDDCCVAFPDMLRVEVRALH